MNMVIILAADCQGTDDMMLVERLGKKVKIVSTNSKNIKITYPEDLDFIKNLLKP